MKKILPDESLLGAIKCPICGASVTVKDGSLLCCGARRHCYDFSSSGYINLMPSGRSDSGDSKTAVAARKSFLSLEHYRPAALALADTVKKYLNSAGGIVVDAGCGEGYYTCAIAECGYSTAGIDISKYAAEAAAKRANACGIKNGFFCVGSVFELSFADESVDIVTNVFAPCSEEEFCRVLKKGGYLVVMYAGREHLMGLKEAIYDSVRKNDERCDLPKEMKLAEIRRVKFDITVKGAENLQNLFAMTPYYWKTSVKDGEKLKNLNELKTAVDMVIAVYQKA